MNRRATLLKVMTAGFAFAALGACGGGGSDPNSPEFQAYEQRHEVMETLGEAILVVNDMAREQIPVDEDAFLAASRSLAANSMLVLDGFENQTLVPESRTEPAVWENWDDFVAKTNDLIAATTALADAAESGGFAAARGLVEPARNTCGACHRVYRAPEEE